MSRMIPPALPELLCPAGDEAALRAAVDSGANAVYLGYKAFGARASATNFDDETLARAVAYAHLYHVRVHVTVNTLVKPAELDGVRAALEAIAQAGADAVIVQDIGVADLVRQAFPTLALHASTQMAICGAEGARVARRLGFERVVLARECSFAVIRDVAATGIETEVFAHGALCTAVSGRCLMSSMAGGRSGNRGRCAQPCRQTFRFDDGQPAPLISMRDLCLWADLPALCEAGVASLKVEGRLKSAEYVAVVASVYRRALDDIAAGRFDPNDPAPMEALMQVFNRGGFTRGHAMGAQDAALITPERVSHEGLPLGTVTQVRRGVAMARLTRDLHDGDSLQLRGGQDGDFRYSGPEVAAGAVAALRLRPGLEAAPGMRVSRLSDARQLEAARRHKPKPIPVNLLGCFAVGQPMRLSLSDGAVSVTVEGETVEAARSRSTTADEAKKQLEKLGGTPFTAPQGAQVVLEDGCFLPVGALNALRRDAVERLTEARIRAFGSRRRGEREADARLSRAANSPIPATDAAPRYPLPASPINADTLAVIFPDAGCADELRRAGADLLIYDPHDLRSPTLREALALLPPGAWLRLPPQAADSVLHEMVELANASTLGGVVAESVGQLALPFRVPVLAGEGVPVTNPRALETLSRTGVCGFTLWPEWTQAEQEALAPSMPCLLKVYGRETLMLLNHCPERVLRGLSSGREACALCRNARQVCARENPCLIDRRGYRFPLVRTRCPDGCEIAVLNALSTSLAAHDAARKALGAGALLRFTIESPQEQTELVRAFRALVRDGVRVPHDGPTTAGHWLRGVE